MDNEYENEDDNRTIRRIPIECPLTYNIVNQKDIKKGIAIDISNSGIKFLANEKLEEGTLIDIRLHPLDETNVPLSAVVQVLRVEVAEGINNQYKTAAVIKILK